MKYFFITLLLSLFNAQAAEYRTIWEKSPETGSLEKKIQMTCQEEEDICEEACADSQECTFMEPTCMNCIGTDIMLTHIFKEMGRSFHSTGETIQESEVLYLLRTGDFVSLTSKSIYNHTQRYNSQEMQKRFRSLCPTFINFPIVFFESDPKNRKIGQVKFVICGENYFDMTDRPRLQRQDEHKLEQFLM